MKFICAKKNRPTYWLLSLLFAIAVSSPLPCLAEDVTPPVQAEGEYSFLTNSDQEKIRDDELIDFICTRINEAGVQVMDIKLLVNSSHGAGFLDDMERAFGAGGACPGIPWVAGASSSLNQNNYNPGSIFDLDYQSSWTAALAGSNYEFNVNSSEGVIRNGNNGWFVLPDLIAAGENDGSGPSGRGFTMPLVASGNDGDSIAWDPVSTQHQAVLWRGFRGALGEEFLNDIDNMEESLIDVWPEGTRNIVRPLATKEALFFAISTAIENLDENTQLLIYLTGVGGSDFDFDDVYDIAGVPIEEKVIFEFNVPDGWFEGLRANELQGFADLLIPRIEMDIAECEDCTDWDFCLNDHPMERHEAPERGSYLTPKLNSIVPGLNRLKIDPLTIPKAENVPNTKSAGNKPQGENGLLTLSGMTFTTGPLNPISLEQVLVPGQTAAYYDPDRNGEGIFVELLDGQLALVYIFSYPQDGVGQAWMLGLGLQTGEGIVVMSILQPKGAKFGPDFDAADIVTTDFGSMVFKFPACGNNDEKGSLDIYPEAATNYDVLFSENYAQLSRLVSCDTGEGSVNVKYSGSWFDPSHNGEGIIFQVLDNGKALVQWFTYDDMGEQMWLQGIGEFDGNTLTVDNLYTAAGTAWGNAFDAGDITTTTWGSLQMVFNNCGSTTVTYDSVIGFGSGVLNMQRLTNLMGIPCED